MWLFPLAATLVALVFAALLGRQFLQRRRPYQAAWALALLLYAAASFALFLGAVDGWTGREYRAYWVLGAVLTVPFLALGEVYLLVARRSVGNACLLGVAFASGFAVNRVAGATLAGAALGRDLPLGKEVWAADPFVLHLAQFYAYPTYTLLVLGTLWSAWRMRGTPQLRDRFQGTLAIAVGATVVAAGSAFAATGLLAGFSITLTVGIAAMFWGFLRASRRAPVPTAPAAATA